MTLKLFNTKTKTLEEFSPISIDHANAGAGKDTTPGASTEVKIYVCGATVQASPHIGHLRASVSFDTLHRYLKFLGYKVNLIRNVTDINEKIVAKGEEAGRTWYEHAYIYEQEFTKAYETLKVLPPSYEPRASANLPEMVAFINRLLEKGYAYTLDSGVYFDTGAWSNYGDLTNQHSKDQVIADEDDDLPGKKSSRDFALWKLAPKTEIGFETELGYGNPGWHIECSTMALKYLGESFDIHGGGLDLRFPHHENEMAQSNAAGYGFANTWMHSAWVTMKGEKMSKSIGNTLGLDQLLEKTSPYILRFILSRVHYRTNIEWDDQLIEDAINSVKTIKEFALASYWFAPDYKKMLSLTKKDFDEKQIYKKEEFYTAMNNDLNVSEALAIIYSQIKHYKHSRFETEEFYKKNLVEIIFAELTILGINPLEFGYNVDNRLKQDENDTVQKGKDVALDKLIQGKIGERAEARANKDFVTSDKIRDELKELGIVLEDNPSGTSWNIC